MRKQNISTNGSREKAVLTAAGGHNAILVGPAGCEKAMPAQRMPSILPPMTHAEALDVTAVYSIAAPDPQIVRRRPFRRPHHTGEPD